MAAVLLDSTILIDVLRERSEAVARLRQLREAGDVPQTCAVIVEEIVRGLRPSELDPAGRLFAGLREVPLGTREGWQAGEWRRAFAAQGVTLSQSDCLIAAAAFGIGARLATANVRDFPMEEITVEDWSRR